VKKEVALVGERNQGEKTGITDRGARSLARWKRKKYLRREKEEAFSLGRRKLN